MEIDQITSLVSIFSFGQHLIAAGGHKDTCPTSDSCPPTSGETVAGPENDKKSGEDDSDSESDTSSDSGHSSDDHDTSSDKDKEEEVDTKTSGEDTPVLTKLTRTVQSADLCSSSVASPNLNSDSPLCVEVASV